MNLRSLFSIAGITAREFLHERVFYLLVGFGLVAFTFSFLLGQLTYIEKSKLTLDFLLAGIQLAVVLFALFMGVWNLQREQVTGSIALILSKPIPRWTYILGKFLGQISIQALLVLGFFGLSVAICRSQGIEFNGWALSQSLVLTWMESCVLAAVAYFFAVNTGALVAGAAAMTVFLVGHFTQSAAAIQPELNQNVAWLVFRSIVPDLEVFNMKSLAAYSLTMAGNSFSLSLLYGTVSTAIFLLCAMICFQRKDILT